MIVDGGAPQISLAQAEFEEMAKLWQYQAAYASSKAMYYTELASLMNEIYKYQIDRSHQ